MRICADIPTKKTRNSCYLLVFSMIWGLAYNVFNICLLWLYGITVLLPLSPLLFPLSCTFVVPIPLLKPAHLAVPLAILSVSCKIQMGSVNRRQMNFPRQDLLLGILMFHSAATFSGSGFSPYAVSVACVYYLLLFEMTFGLIQFRDRPICFFQGRYDTDYWQSRGPITDIWS